MRRANALNIPRLGPDGSNAQPTQVFTERPNELTIGSMDDHGVVGGPHKNPARLDGKTWSRIRNSNKIVQGYVASGVLKANARGAQVEITNFGSQPITLDLRTPEQVTAAAKQVPANG